MGHGNPMRITTIKKYSDMEKALQELAATTISL